LNQRAPIESSSEATATTRRAQFLADMDRIIPWAELERAVEQLYASEALEEARVAGVHRMLRVYLLQQWFNLSDAALEEALRDSATMRQFARVSTSTEPIPDEPTIRAFRTLLARHEIGEEILAIVRRQLKQHGARITEVLAASMCVDEISASTPLAIVRGPDGPRPDPEAVRQIAADALSHLRAARAPGDPHAVELALSALGVGVFECDPVEGMRRFSDRCRNIWGLGPEELPTQERLLELVHPDDQHLVAVLCDSLKPDGPEGFSVELRVVRPDGALRWVLASGRTVFQVSPNGRVPLRSYGTLLDVTDQRLTERKLYELDSQLSTFIDGAPASIATFDSAMRYLEVSQKYAEDRGLTAADLIGRCVYDVFPNFPERWRAAHARCLKGASERCDLDVFVRADGTRDWVCWELRPWFRADQTVGGLVLLSEVITQRVRAQRRLHESEARLELAIRAGALGIYDYDILESACAWDARVRELWGVGLNEEITPETFLTGLHPDDRVNTMKLLEDSLGPEGNGTHAAEYRVVNRRDGSTRWIQSTGTVFFDQGRAVRMVGIVQDITDRKQAQLALERSAAELKRADERKDAFLATLSHELRNPLAPIRTAAQILASPNLKAEQLDWARQVIQRQTAHMASLLDDLLDVARITRGKLVLKKERVALASVVESAVEAARPLLDEKHHRLELSLGAAHALTLEADPLRLSQVLSNLLGNAAKYTEPGGLIQLTAWLHEGTLSLSVKDNGIGIPREALGQIFDMFWQVEDSSGAAGGLGIGLAFVKSLVELHGGTIEAHSEGRGCGSEFIMHLPVGPAAAAPAPAPVLEVRVATGR
jgi:PAS domain S-box-containing protein